ncbi:MULTISPECIES: P-II family nitrogen regulator [Methanosarcina]|uniref:Nitrogen regulatory protein P-II n=3 Tax=Methanosarcina barkeri TaxID=2208 RepID=A0A0E3QSQ1_METBA|nr:MULTISPECIES: P-II family nitrogen regulator [Methanosarcina]AKB53575.1 Nitrogen regulatory protein P-II [Methanosarcina barkeri MS]AKB58318.1 Nitrogen regulatory protein P-II [Methanosarcina barkeri 227]AKJ39105.1 nitrogen regulatory protein P-II GlnK2 [Methanosarcina barkeri CM1]OED12674.1 transcriptional regulator [Methanosarcina sp. A14]
MKKIEAIIRPTKLEEVKASLEDAGFNSLTIIDVKGRGQQKGIIQQWRGQEYRVDALPKTKIELVVNDEDEDKAIDVIVSSTRTGNIGDGKIFVLPVEKVIRIRTGERDGKAI